MNVASEPVSIICPYTCTRSTGNPLEYHPEDLPFAARAYGKIILCPLFPSVEDQDIDYVASCRRF